MTDEFTWYICYILSVCQEVERDHMFCICDGSSEVVINLFSFFFFSDSCCSLLDIITHIFLSAFVCSELASPPTWSLVPLILHWKAHRSNTSSAYPQSPHQWCVSHICPSPRICGSCFISDLRYWFQNHARIWLAPWQIWNRRKSVGYHIGKDNSWEDLHQCRGW